MPHHISNTTIQSRTLPHLIPPLYGIKAKSAGLYKKKKKKRNQDSFRYTFPQGLQNYNQILR